MRQRIITALVIAVVVFAFLLLASDYIWGVGVFAVAMLGASEWIKFAKVNDNDTVRYLGVFAAFSVVVSMLFKYVLFIFPIFWIYAAYKLYQYEKEKLSDFSSSEMLVLGAFALSPFAASLYVLHTAGIAWIFLFILVVAAADSGAYFVGKAMGENKMLPRLSPNKTIEGLIGGFIVAIIVSLVFLVFMDIGFVDYILMVIVCGITAVVSVEGDVFESMMKRVAGVKDSGNILPGHGGILDRVDGYMPALPVFILLGYLIGVFSL